MLGAYAQGIAAHSSRPSRHLGLHADRRKNRLELCLVCASTLSPAHASNESRARSIEWLPATLSKPSLRVASR